MKTQKNILIAFLLNLSFSIFELIGGVFSNSVAILSDSVHDFGDALSIGISYFLEKKSQKKPDEKYTYGYVRYSVLGSFITTIILLAGSILVIYQSVQRIIEPVSINYDGMLIFAIVGVIVNFIAAYTTKEGESLNQKSVNLHMLEDVLGWVVVLIGAIIMRFTDISLLDPILSIAVAIFILIHASKNFMTVIDLFLERTPKEIDMSKLKEHITQIEGVKNVHHIHVWSMDGFHNYATMHIVSSKIDIKQKVKEKLKEYGITHATIELETEEEHCEDESCNIEHSNFHLHHHHK